MGKIEVRMIDTVWLVSYRRKMAVFLDELAAYKCAVEYNATIWPIKVGEFSNDMFLPSRSPATGRRRYALTQELLQNVAAIYNGCKTGAPSALVAANFDTGHRNAVRWIRAARDAGLIEPLREKKTA